MRLRVAFRIGAGPMRDVQGLAAIQQFIRQKPEYRSAGAVGAAGFNFLHDFRYRYSPSEVRLIVRTACGSGRGTQKAVKAGS